MIVSSSSDYGPLQSSDQWEASDNWKASYTFTSTSSDEKKTKTKKAGPEMAGTAENYRKWIETVENGLNGRWWLQISGNGWI